MTNAIWAYGTLFQIGDGLGGFTTVAEVMDIKLPQLKRDIKEVTSHSSPNGYEEHIPTIKRTAEVTFNINYVPTDATHNDSTGLLSLYDSGALTPFKIVLTDVSASVWTFSGYVIGATADAPVNGQLAATVTIKPVGQVVLP